MDSFPETQFAISTPPVIWDPSALILSKFGPYVAVVTLRLKQQSQSIFFFSRNVLLTNKGVTCYTIDNNNVETSTFTGKVSSVNFDIGPGTTCQHPAVSAVFKAFTANRYQYRS